MDCKALIEQLHAKSQTLAAYNAPELAHALEDAATALETLLAERDAAVDELHGMCWCCAHGKKWDKAPARSKLITCEHMMEILGAIASAGKTNCPHWQWRGPGDHKEAQHE